MYKLIPITLLSLFLLGLTEKEITGEVVIQNPQKKENIKIPQNFNPESANIELINARESGNKELAGELSKYIHEWWKMNREKNYSPITCGFNPEPGKNLKEENSNFNQNILKWGNDVRIDPRNGVNDVKITSLSTGELYTISKYFDGTNYHVIVHRSTDNGETWNIYWDNTFSTGYSITSPGILAVNDTLVLWYILIQNDTLYRTWFITALPGNSFNPISFGSPTGGFNDNVRYRNLDFTTDAAIFGIYEWNYATWVEYYYVGTDSTSVMFARSNELNVSNWELGPVKVMKTSGDNIYYYHSKISFGAPYRLWIIAPIHPYGYPNIYDECIGGVYSNDYGASWTPSNPFSPLWITPFNDHYDDFECDLAASYIDSNWVILVTRTDTGLLHFQDLNLHNYYSTNGGNTWNFQGWVFPDFNFSPDVYVDNSSTAFYAVFRKDIPSGPYEEVRLKIGNINDPSSWTDSYLNIINDDNTDNLSDAFGPYVSYNPSTNEPVVVWTSFEGSTYSIWFDAQTRVKISERIINERKETTLIPSIGKNNLKISFNIPNPSNVEINIYSPDGRIVKNILNSKLNKGNYTYNIKNTLRSGKYFLKLETENTKLSIPLIIVK
ncbi:MAG: T9SS type A sorting domain-containing protein [candidate division WOR-3 bacterium]